MYPEGFFELQNYSFLLMRKCNGQGRDTLVLRFLVCSTFMYKLSAFLSPSDVPTDLPAMIESYGVSALCVFLATVSGHFPPMKVRRDSDMNLRRLETPTQACKRLAIFKT